MEDSNAILARLDERTKAIREDIAEIKRDNKANTDAIGSLKDGRAKVRGVLWALSFVVATVGGERIVEWLTNRH